MYHSKRIIALSVSAALLGNACFVKAAEPETDGKEEVVYVNADADGSVSGINVVNIISGGDVVDYGDYTSVKMLTTTDPITQDGKKISFHSDAEKVYYQGTLKEDTPIPWDIRITYELDGTPISAENLAGKSGALTIHFVVEKNEQCAGTFYDDYALQASFTLDTEICTSIETEGATVANVGSDKQISYTILPGKGIDTEIQADVTNFEMDAVSINGVQMNLNVDVDDEELQEKVEEIIDATEQLNSGASLLYDGATELSDGGSQLESGMTEFHSGVKDLDTGIQNLQTGLANMQTGLNTLNGQSATLTSGSSAFFDALKQLQTELSGVSFSTEDLTTLTESSAQIKQGISDAYDGAALLQANLGYEQYKAAVKEASGGTLDIDMLLQQNTSTIDTIDVQLAALNQDPVGNAAQIVMLSNIKTLLNGNTMAINGVNMYLTTLLNGVNGSGGVNDLVAGLETLKTSYETFDGAINTLATTISGMAVSMTTLSSAVNTLVTEYEKLDTGIDAYTDGVATIVAGYQQLVSGVSTLASGSKTLLDASGNLKSGTADLYDGIVSLCDGSLELADGTEEFYNEAQNMDQELQDQIDELLASISGGDTEPVSFASKDNHNVASVQFVIQTEAIEVPEVEVVVPEEEEETSFWQKLKNLF